MRERAFDPRARRQAATSTDLVADVRVWPGFTAALGATDDARLHRLTIALLPQWAALGYSTRRPRKG